MELPLDSLDLRYTGLRARRPALEKRLVASLGEAGQQSPVVVVPAGEAGRYVVIDGHKRVRALIKLRADVVRAAVWEMPAVEALVTAYQMASGAGWNAVEEGWLAWELVRVAGLSIRRAAAGSQQGVGVRAGGIGGKPAGGGVGGCEVRQDRGVHGDAVSTAVCARKRRRLREPGRADAAGRVS